MNADSCPECGELLPPKAIRCACGWKAVSKVPSGNLHQCEWREGGIRCGKDGTLASRRGPDSHWLCAQHFFGSRKPTAKYRQSGLVAVAELQAKLHRKLS